MPIQSRLAPIVRADADQRTFDLVWSTGAQVRRFDWYNDRVYLEELSMDPAHIRMDRFKSGGAPVLDTHGRYSLRDVLGVVESASIDNGEGRARVRFSQRADVEPIVQDVRDKIIRNVSVGYAVYRVERIAPKKDGDPWIYRVVDWEPQEISLVPIGADPKAGTREAPEHQRTVECVFDTSEGNRAMPTDDPTKDDAIRAERERTRTILQLCETARLDTAFTRSMIDSERTVEQVRDAILTRMAEQSERTQISSSVLVGLGGRGPSLDDPEQRARLMGEALAARYGGPAPSDQARQFVNLRIRDMARELLELRGVRTSDMSADEIIRRAYGGGLHGTSDFAILLAESGNRMLLAAYRAYTGGLRQICRQSSAVDFRAKTKVRLGEAPALEKVNEHGEFTRGSMATAKESYTLATFGRIFGITRQALVNDDLGAFADMTRHFGRAAVEFEAGFLVKLLTSNPTMDDGVALFHATHGNLGTTGAIGETTLSEIRKTMRLQKGLDKKTPIDVTPKYLIVPAAQETVAEKVIGAISATEYNNVNPFAGRLTLIGEPRLDAHSATAWYVSADPAVFDTIEYSYLESQPGPQMEVREGFDVDGVETKVRLDYGAGVMDFRGLAKNAGA